MTPNEFRKQALAFSGAIESAHMNHPDFRLNSRIFATLGYPDTEWGMVKLSLEEQRNFVEKSPAVFQPCNGAWGRGGATQVRLSSAVPSLVKASLKAAVENALSPPKNKKR
jgi:hypothetical protein